MTEAQDIYPLKITRKGIITWSVLILFAMGWMFVVGILVGRGTAPGLDGPPTLQNELETLKEERLQKQRALIEDRAKQNKEGGAHLPFYDELRKPSPKNAYKIAPSAAEKRPAPPPSAAETPPEKPAPKPVETPVEKPAPEKKPILQKKESPPPAVKPAPQVSPPPEPVETQNRFTVQVGAFKDVESADRMVKHLRDQGFPAYHLRVSVPGKGNWYRVRVGAFENRSAAETLLKKMDKKGVKGIVVGT